MAEAQRDEKKLFSLYQTLATSLSQNVHDLLA
jgi:hypothetical protein